MRQIAYRREMLRGQIEELTGRLEATTAELRAPGDFGEWLRSQVRGRMLQLRGRGRQMAAAMQLGTLAITPLRRLPPGWRRALTTIGPIALGVVILGIIIRAIWPTISGQWPEASRRVQEGIGQRGMGTEQSTERFGGEARGMGTTAP